MHNLSQKKVLNYKALALFSGGLDSILAVLFIRAQGIQVEGVYFESPFFPRNQAVKSAEQINLPLKIVDITHDILALVRHPRFGYGQGLNPCLDCHLLMCNKACEIMHQEGYNFIISGEVLGQRPLSQTKQAMLKINKECLCSDYIVRPLSGKLLPPTIPEQKGIVQREMLLDIRGRSRKKQMQLATQLGLKTYPSPAGGCLLTDQTIAARLRDLLAHQKNILPRDLELLKLGRHFRLNPATKAIVGRNREENKKIEALGLYEDALLETIDYPSPLVLIPFGGDLDGQKWAAMLTASYSDAPLDKSVSIKMKWKGEEKILFTSVCSKEKLHKYLIQKLEK
ncbi:thiamin biosynthesis protein ThiI [Candidatus Desulfofervidus auxilii]|uniref:Thiamin biosynthesis protein ThiI n=1 Tax=Desulfofervidus auxilii TaxID=1621989 RepID=A0A7U4QJK5_DESA2|nr:hypothetical protein [Candidatus Desulfofervidus auxilii]AMM40496.1 thiamin biosynthesis protein ThiI [Candidatus Desulfofervidus auxilii]